MALDSGGDTAFLVKAELVIVTDRLQICWWEDEGVPV